jgi:peptidoglycan/LPS O-acetylase OafA/YrhL
MRVMALLVALMIALLVMVGQSREAIQAAVLVAIIWAVSRLPAAAEPFGGRDLSYGVYLAHFPLIHLLIAGGAAAVLPAGAFVALVVVLAGLYALASWHLIEKPALALGKPRRQPAAIKERVA